MLIPVVWDENISKVDRYQNIKLTKAMVETKEYR